MSKKGNKAQPEKKQIEIVDQQKDPMLRALQKKVRNINKKLNEIAQLSAKKDLKPEQEEKISKKNQIAQEKEKYLQMIEIYKQISGESEKIIRKTQLAELEDLAHILVAKEYNVDLGFLFNQNVDNLVRILTTPTSNQLNLRQRLDEISQALFHSANNLKLKKSLRQLVQANPEKKRDIVGSSSIQPEPLSSQSQKERQAQLKDFQTEEKQQQTQKIQAPILTATQVVTQQPTPDLVTPPENAESQKSQVVEKNQVPIVEGSNNLPTENAEKNGQQKEEGKQEKRGYRGYRGREKPRGERNGEKHTEETKPYKKRNFKPKYENEQNQRKESSSSSSSGSEPKARQFKREEVRELIEDGFIVVGKPKIKAKDQKEFYDHQHGKKHHHHQSKKNY